jgi:NAD(P)-dependent dehydrogenase (short-subunit alcohol dehydrogenase family)
VRGEAVAHEIGFESRDRVRVQGGISLDDEAGVSGYYAALPEIWASIHCAGGFAMAPAEATSLAEFERMHAMNAVSAFLCCREAAKRMPAGGRLVNVAALAGLEPRDGAGKVAYAVSKASVVAMTLALAEEWAPRGIWVNAVVPSTMDTKANRAAMPKADPSKWATLPAVASTIVFLASPQNEVTRAALVPVYGRG